MPKRFTVAALCTALVLTGASCSSDEDEPDAQASVSRTGSETPAEDPAATETATESVSPEPEGLITSGMEVDVGEPAQVPVSYQPEDGPVVSSTVELAVQEVEEGQIGHLSGFELGSRAERSRPFYVTVEATNAGEANLGGLPVLLFGNVDDNSAVVQPVVFETDFRRCGPSLYPQRFGPGRTAEVCLTFLVPNGSDLTGVQVREDNEAVITWPVD